MEPRGGVGANIEHLFNKLKSYDLKPKEAYVRGLWKRIKKTFGTDYIGIKKQLVSEILKNNTLSEDIRSRLISEASRENIDAALIYIKKECEANKLLEIERQRTFDSGHNQPERNGPDKTQDDRLSRSSYVNKEESPQTSKPNRKSLSSGADKISEQTHENSSPSVRESLEEVPVHRGNSPIPVPRKKQPTPDESAFLTAKKQGAVVNKTENPDDRISAQSSAVPAKTKPLIAKKPVWTNPVRSYEKKNSDISRVSPPNRKSLSSGADKISEQTHENSSSFVRESLEELPVPRKKQPTPDESAFLTAKKQGAVVNKTENPDDQISAQSSAVPAKTKPPIVQKPVWRKPVRSYEKKNSEISSVSPAATTSEISLSEAKPVVRTARREVVGGKGMFLEHMKQHGIPVPDFKCVGIPEMQAIERLQLSRNILFQSMPDIQRLNLAEPISLFTLKEMIQSLTDEAHRYKLLNQLSTFISSDVFYRVVKDQEPAQVIRGYFGELCGDRSGQKIIVRSSGAKEDGYGDAQAGKYESLVHSEDDIVRTCLKVMASGYRPEVCSGVMPSSMALVMQHCVDCQFGGVIMSYSSLKDDTVQIEYVPGQPKGAVAGQYGITPHRFAVQRLSDSTHFEHTPGNVTRAFTLEQQEGHGAIEKLTPVDAEQPGMMDDDTARKLYQHIEQLENLLNSPVDAEFGINQDGEVKILQLRPVTRLQGGVRFSMAAPSESIAEGTLVSEGVCQGPLMEVKPGETRRVIPQGAIIAAHHGEDWMLAPDVLNKVGGFVFQQGGTGDHVAITLRQAGKPCLITGSHLSEGSETSQKEVTLVCGEFNNQPGALLLAGSQFENLKANALPATSGDFSEAIARTDRWRPEASLPDRVDEQFQWLNEQNRRLLDYFNEERLLSQCLSPEHSVLLSMSPQRTQVLAKLREEVSHFLNDTEALLQGYERFLQSGAIKEDAPPKIVAFLENLEALKTCFSHIKSRVDRQLDAVTNGLMSEEELLASPGDFSQWRAGCQTLQETLQQLSLPRKAEDVDSIHDVIFLVHKSFVDILGEVAQASGQGEQIQKSERVTLVNFPTPGCEPILDEGCIESVSGYGARNTILNMKGAAIINTDIQYHKGVIEAVEKGSGDKGRMLKIRMTDNFNNKRVPYYFGKFKRFLFLAQTLNAISKSQKMQGVSVEVNEGVGEIVFEITNIPDSDSLRRQLKMIVGIMKSTTDQDNWFERPTQGLASVCDFSRLNQLLSQLNDQESLMMFDSMFFQIAYHRGVGSKWKYPLLMMMIDNSGDRKKYSEMYDFILNLSRIKKKGGKIELTKKEFNQYQDYIKLLLIVDPKAALPMVETHSNWLTSKGDILPLVRLNGKLLKHLPTELRKDKDVVLAAVTHSPMALKYADKTLLSDFEVLESASSGHPDEYYKAVHIHELGRNALLTLLRQPKGSFDVYTIIHRLNQYSKDKEIMTEAKKHDNSVADFLG